jgi:phage terminase large subunit
MEIKIDANIFNQMYLPYVTDYSKKYEVYKGGAGSGKSHYVTQKIIIKALQSKRKVLLMRKVGSSIKDSIWQLTLDILSQFKIKEQCKINKSDFNIELPNGSVFLFKGLDDPEKIKSITGLTDIVLEEATEFTLADISQLKLRLRSKAREQQMYFMFNPISKDNWTYVAFKFHLSEENEIIKIRKTEDTIIFNSSYLDNRFLGDDYVKTLNDMKETNPNYYQIYVLGRFCTLDKLVYPYFESYDFDYREILRQEETKAIFGMDFGYINDPSAFVGAIVDEKENKLYIYKEMYQKGMLNKDVADWIKRNGFSKEEIIADSAEQKSIAEIKKEGVTRIKPCRKGKGSILAGIDKVSSYKLIVHPSCTNTITELQNYAWKKNKQGEYVNEPIDKYNHLMDALRYAMQSIKKKAKILNVKL